MSARIRAYFVSWPMLVAEYAKHPKDDMFSVGHAIEDGAKWAEDANLDTDSSITAIIASDAYEETRLSLPASVLDRLDHLFAALFWEGPRGWIYVRDLGPASSCDGALASTMKLETVQALLALWDEGEFELLREPFAQHLPEGNARMRTFDDFNKYVTMWIALLREADQRGCGLVISVL